MDKIKKEIGATSNPWIKKIGNYLLSREDLYSKLDNPKKNLKECFDYILIQISKQAKKDGNIALVCGEDEELYALAVHYFDEDDIKVDKKNFTTNADGSADLSKLVSLSKEKLEKEPIKDDSNIDDIVEQKVKEILAKQKQEEERKRKEKRATSKKRKEEISKAQLSLFD